MRVYPALTLTWTRPVAAERVELLLAELDGAGATALEERNDSVRIFFATAADRDAAFARFRDVPDVTPASIDVQDDDWAARSQAALGPVTVGRLTIAPPWSVTPDLNAQPEHLVVILPSMGFGTGHHATTRLCLGHLQRLGPEGATVLDVGTGSGVLAIASARLGAALAVGIDVDEDALANARENVERNAVAARVSLHELDLGGAAAVLGRRFDIIVANLTGGLLCREAGTFAGLAAPGARLVASGFQTHERAPVLGAFEDAGWRLVDEAAEQDWVGAVLSRLAP